MKVDSQKGYCHMVQKYSFGNMFFWYVPTITSSMFGGGHMWINQSLTSASPGFEYRLTTMFMVLKEFDVY